MKFDFMSITWPQIDGIVLKKNVSREEALRLTQEFLISIKRWPAPYPNQRQTLGAFLELRSDNVDLFWGLTYELHIWRSE